MKKILLGTTTLVGMALAANAALAESPKVTVGGFSEFQLGVVGEDLDANTRSHAFRSDNEISFKVDGKSDAGLGYGAEIWLEADTTADADTQGVNASKTFVYLDGIWGRVEMGSNLGVDQTLKIDAASIARATGGIDGDFTYFASSAAQYIATPDLPLNYGVGALGNESRENLNKVSYYTPRWSGFQAGISYLPDMRNRGQQTDRSDNNSQVSENIFLGGVNYQGQWDQIGFGLAATGEWGDAETSDTEDLRAWNAGAKVSFLGFSVAGSYGDLGDSNRLKVLNADNTHYWTLGGAYEYGPFGASVTYLDSHYDTGPAGDNKFRNVSVGADYKLAPGLTPYAEVNFFKQDAVGSVNDNDGHVFLLGTSLNF
jgi:predicted porin